MINRAFYCVANYGLDLANKILTRVGLVRQGFEFPFLASIPGSLKSLAFTSKIKFSLLNLNLKVKTSVRGLNLTTTRD